MNTSRIFFTVAASLGALGVILGAFGAHALKSKLGVDQLATFETGVRYQMYHVFALIAVASLLARSPSSAAVASGWFFLAGIALFSGSLYLLALKSWTWLGPVTPLGGLCFIIGWITLAVAAARN